MTKVGEHITLDIIGTKKEYDPAFFEKLVYKIGNFTPITTKPIYSECYFIRRICAPSFDNFFSIPT